MMNYLDTERNEKINEIVKGRMVIEKVGPLLLPPEPAQRKSDGSVLLKPLNVILVQTVVLTKPDLLCYKKVKVCTPT